MSKTIVKVMLTTQLEVQLKYLLAYEQHKEKFK